MTFRRLMSGYGSSLLNIISGLLTTLWLLGVVARRIGKEDFGLYNLVLQAVGYLAIVQIGLDMAVYRTIAEKLGANDTLGARRAYSQLARFNRWGAMLAALITAVTVAVLAACNYSSLTLQLVGFTGMSQVVQFLARTPGAALVGSHQQVVVNILSTARSVFITCLAYTLIRLEMGILALPVADMIGQWIGFGVLKRIAQQRCLWIPGEVLNPNEGFSGLVKYGVIAALGGIAWTIESGADVFLIDMVPGGGGRDMVATYVLWWRFPQMAFAVTTNLSTVAFPGFAATHTDTTHVRPLFRKVALTSTAIIFVMVVGIGLWLTPFVRHWVGSQYGIPDGPRLALLMALLVAFRTLGNLLGLFWLATGKAGLTTVLCWVQAVVKVALAFVLIRIDGVHGLVTASVVSILVQVVGIGWPLAKRGLFELRLVVATGFWLAVASAIVLMLGPEVQDARFNTMVIGIITTAILASGVMGVWLKSLGLFPRRIKNSAEVKG